MSEIYLVEEREFYDREWIVVNTFCTFHPERFKGDRYKKTKLIIRAE